MRKYVVGCVFGILVATAFSANAEEIQSLIGKEIQGSFPVKINGEKLEKDAIVVDGSSYLPVRAFGESVGYAVYFDPEMGIDLVKKEVTPVSTSTPNATESPKPDPKNTLPYVNSMIRSSELRIYTITAEIQLEKDPERLVTWNKKLADEEAKLAELQKKKAELEAQQTP